MRTTGGITNRAEEVIARCRKLARFSEDSGSTRRTFLSAPMRDCHREIAGWMTPLGAEVRIDAAGNLRGFYAGAESNAPRLLVGSHLDTVPNAGAYDGVLGVVLAVALLRLWMDDGFLSELKSSASLRKKEFVLARPLSAAAR